MSIQECVFYIHGVIPDRLGRPHNDEYRLLHNGIHSNIVSSPWPSTFGGAEWGWQPEGSTRESHRALADAQKIYGGKILDKVTDTTDYTLNVARMAVNQMRKIMMFGFGDMFYYVSTSGKWAVRSAVAEQIANHIQSNVPEDNAISLSLIGHSAGSVIAFDLLYYLFITDKKFNSHSWLEELGKVQDEAKKKEDVASLVKNLSYLRNLIKAQKLRLRLLVTLGSPISMLMYRGDSLVELLAAGKVLDPAEYGLESEIPGNNLIKGRPRWVNYWDKDDPISWPVESIMGNTSLVKDDYIDVSDSVAKAHNEYWTSDKIHASIAEHWSQLSPQQ